MYQITKCLKSLALAIAIIFSCSVAVAQDFDLSKANSYIAEVDSRISDNASTYITLKGLYTQLERINYQAQQCIQSESKQIASIGEVEKVIGLSDDTNSNTDDVKYITNKKKRHVNRLSQCRLLLLKSQDKMDQVQDAIHDLHHTRVLSFNDKALNVLDNKQPALYTFVFFIMIMAATYVGYRLFLRDQIKTLHLTRVTKIFEVRLLKASLFLLLSGWFVLFLLQWWDSPSLVVKKIQDFLINGTTVYGIKVIPLRLVFALLLFSVIQIIGKYLAMRITNQAKFEDEEETQVVIGSLISYIVFAIALLCALSVTGVDFTGLAIVAGALSVGIGFGLQNIVNNFVSGLILLIEKPIRPGDRIMIKGIEGYVQEINIRTTRMVSFLKEEIIFPNSDLVSNPITNFVLHDTLSKLTCRVCVSYSNDVKLVTGILLNVALQHSQVIKDKRNEPTVMLIDLKEHGMLFELGCVVKHVDQKVEISSELNVMIIEQFKANKIIMSLPQLAVHLVEGVTN